MGRDLKEKMKVLLFCSANAFVIQSNRYSNGSQVGGNWGGGTQTGYTWPAGIWFNKYWPCDYNAVISGQVEYPGCRPKTNEQTSTEVNNTQDGIIFTNGESQNGFTGQNGIITTNGKADHYLQANQVLVKEGPLSAINYLERSLGK